MARIRTIKPEFCVSEQITECSVSTRLLFILMWMHCDDYGNHPAKLMQLKAECFPCDPFTRDEMQSMIDELLRQGLIAEYSANDGAKYWHVTGWSHQLINRRGEPKYPQFTEDAVSAQRDSVSDQGVLPPEGKGREGKGKDLIEASASCAERSANAACTAHDDGKPRYRFPTKGKGKAAQWELPAAKVAEYRETFVGLDVPAEIRKARQWLIDNPTKRKTPSGMVRFLTAWLSRANDRGRTVADGVDQEAEARKRHLAAEASRREAAEAAARARASPSQIARGALRGVDDDDDEAARRDLQAKLSEVCNERR